MKKSRPYIWYMLPGLIFYTAFMILPIFLTALISLTGFNGVNWDTLTWVGGENYVKLFTAPSNSSVYWNALINNLKFIAVEYVIIIPIQLLVSYAFYRKIHFHNFLEGVFFLPYVFSAAVIGFFSTIVFNESFGMVNKVLMALGVSKVNLPVFYADTSHAFALMMGTGIWYSSVIGMMILLSNMKNIPADVMEAATVDGANEWKKFIHIILPDLGPGMINIIVLDAIWGITAFDLPYVLGGPYGRGGAIDFVNMMFYRTAFGSGAVSSVQTDYGLAAAIGTTTFVVILILTGILQSGLRRVKVWNE